MDTITPLQREDIPGVSRLFMRVFRQLDEDGPSSLREYLEALYLNNPWSFGSLSSLISRGADGKIIGFIGSIPRPMDFRGRRIMTAVAGNHMVDPANRDPFVAVRLLKKLLSQGQELTFSDSANAASCRMWEGIGGRISLLHSLRWIRFLRPFSYLTSTVTHRLHVPLLGTIVSPLTRLADSPLSRTILNRKELREYRSLTDTDLDRGALMNLSAALTMQQSLRPAYDTEGLDWLLSMARQKKQYGPLTSTVVRDRSETIGAHMFHCKRNEPAEVLSILSKPGCESRVISHLFSRILQRGGVAVMGRANPWNIQSLSAHGCLLFHRHASTVAYSQDTEILDEITKGSAWLSRLEGEWWTRLQGDRFERD